MSLPAEVFIYAVSSMGRALELHWVEEETVFELKKRIKEERSYRGEKLRLFFETQLLGDDSKKLIDYGVTEGSSILFAFDQFMTYNPHKTYENDELFRKLLFIEPHLEADEILSRLFLGSIKSALNVVALVKQNITHILTIHDSLNPTYPNHFEYMWIQADDYETVNIIQHFEKVIQFIEEGRQKGGILVHCQAGVSRSVSLVIAYIMYTKKLSLQSSLELVKSKRNVASPNSGFLKQLYLFEKMQCNPKNEKEEEDKTHLEPFIKHCQVFKVARGTKKIRSWSAL